MEKIKQQPNREVGQKRMNKLVERTKMHKETERKKEGGAERRRWRENILRLAALACQLVSVTELIRN